MKIATDFAPPLSIVAPFFVIAGVFFVVSGIALFGLDVGFAYNDFRVVSWVHLFMLGFVMTVIVGAMAQLIPVLLEKGHSFVFVFAPIPYIFAVGTIMMAYSFASNPLLLWYGGALIAIAVLFYLLDVFATLFSAKRRSLSVVLMWGAHIFLGAAIFVGFFAALSFRYGFEVQIEQLLLSHAALGVIGFMFAIIIGVAVILLPMFGLAHGFSQKPAEYSAWALSLGVIWVCGVSFFDLQKAIPIGFLMIAASIVFFLYQVFLIYKKRVRKESDIWYHSLIVSFCSLVVSLLLMFVAFGIGGDKYLKLSGFIFGTGFLSFLITGHIYKILPFLVWFNRFSPLVGKKKVPMLHQMVPKQEAKFQFVFGLGGVVFCSLGILFENMTLWYCGASFFVIGSVFLFVSIIWMMRFKAGE